MLEIAARRRSHLLGIIAAAGLLLVTGAGLYEPVSRWFAGRANHAIITSSGQYTEQFVLSHALASRLKAAGFHPDQREGMSDGIRLEALRHNQVDCLVEYIGDIWTLLMKQKVFKNRRLGDTARAEVDVVAALAAARLFVAVVARPNEGGDDGAHLALLTVTGTDGRRAMPVFSSVATLARWRPEARPVPVPGRRAALSALAVGHETSVLEASNDR